MIKCNSKAFLSAALFPLAAATVSAADGTIDSGNGFTYQTALSYSVAANWKDGVIAMGEGSVATILTNMWVRIDGDVTLGLLRSSRQYTQLDRPTVFGDGKFTFTAPAAASSMAVLSASPMKRSSMSSSSSVSLEQPRKALGKVLTLLVSQPLRFALSRA